MTDAERLALAARAEQIAVDLDTDPDAYKEHHPGERASFQATLRHRAAQLRAKARGLTLVTEGGAVVGAIARTRNAGLPGWTSYVINREGTDFAPVGYGQQSTATPTEADHRVREEYAQLVRMGDRPALAALPKVAKLPKRSPGATRVQDAIDRYHASVVR